MTDYPLSHLPKQMDSLAHLVMVDNPDYHPLGDYELNNGCIEMSSNVSTSALTYASIAVLRPELFANCQPGHFRLTQVLNPAIKAGKVTGEFYQGKWHNIGRPLDLELVNCL
jgi:MurNAc alpha-1-phosphate uridylyltransferase